MKYTLLLFFIFITFIILFWSCNNDQPPQLVNKSNKNICYILYNNISNKLVYQYSQSFYINYKKDTINNISMRYILLPSQMAKLDLGYSWKRRIKTDISIYIFDNDSLNTICKKKLDSTLIKTVLLKHIVIGYEELKKNKFIITYKN